MTRLGREEKRRAARKKAAADEADQRIQDILDRKVANLSTLFRQKITNDFLMRNQLALDMLDDENVIEDEPVLIYRGDQLGVDAAGSALPQIGVLIATSHRIRFATVDDPQAVDAPIDTVRITHDEDGMLTLAWLTENDQRDAATFQFATAKVGLIKQLRRLILEADKRVDSGPATPRVTTWDRITRQRRR